METNKFITELKALVSEAVQKSEDGKLSIIEILGFIDNLVKIYKAVDTDSDIKAIVDGVKQVIANLSKKWKNSWNVWMETKQ